MATVLYNLIKLMLIVFPLEIVLLLRYLGKLFTKEPKHLKGD